MNCPACTHENRPGVKFGEECAAPLGSAEELARERHLLGQRMLKAVLGHGVERLLVDELGARGVEPVQVLAPRI